MRRSTATAGSGSSTACSRTPCASSTAEGPAAIPRHPFPSLAAGGPRRYPSPGLLGSHQFANAGTAIAATHWLNGFKIDDGAIARGLRNVEWLARMQLLTRGPLVEMLPQGWELWLDGGHNEDAGQVIADMIRDWQDQDRRQGTDLRAHAIFGMLSTKDPVAFLKPLAPLLEDLNAVAISGDHASL